ncbi:MAG: SurA N-terminal domain-containing protein, partial [Sphingomonadaceae bacterium]|nr:SurA N-terminal domain-containing protein [Sphingomonadaceae bacterium]
MRSKSTILLGVALAVALSGCNRNSAEKTLAKGQVVATVGGEDITVYELNAELQGQQIPAGAQRKQVEQAVLQQVITRKILAQIARERGIDKTPAFLLQDRRSSDSLLGQMLRQQLAAGLTRPTDTEIAGYMEGHPDQFANRRIMTIDQIQFQRPADMRSLVKYEPLKTMDQVEAQLKADGLKYVRQPTQLDAAALNPAQLRQITSMPAGEVFIVPAGPALSANVITATRTEPLTGADARNLAITMIQGDKLTRVAKTQLGGKVDALRAGVKYQSGYAPPAGTAAAAKP